MNKQRRQEIKSLAGFVASLPFGILGFLAILITVIPSAENHKSATFYAVGASMSALFILIFMLIFVWAKQQLKYL